MPKAPTKSSKTNRNASSKDKPPKLDFDFAALVASELGGDSSPKFSKKRKQRSVKSSSPEVEIVTSAPMQERKGRKAKPDPTSDDYGILPAVSITAVLDRAMQEASTGNKRAKFGTVEVQASKRPKRAIVKTEKAVASKEAGPLERRRASQANQIQESGCPVCRHCPEIRVLTISQRRGVPLIVPEINRSTPMRTLSAASDSELPSVNELVAMYRSSKQLQAVAGDDDVIVHNGLALVDRSNMELRSEGGGDNSDANKADNESDTIWDGIDEDLKNEHILAADDGDIEEAAGTEDVLTHAEDDGFMVMIEGLQDPMLVPLYKNLPHLPRLCEVRPFSGMTDSARTPFADICARLREDEVRALLQALQFVKSGQYVNTARVDPKHLYADNHRLKNADSKMLTIGIMTGTTTESFILSPCEGGPRHSPWNMHKVTIAPFTQDMRRDTSLWGLVLDFHVIAGLTSSLGFTFSTRAEGHGDSQNTSYASSSTFLSKSNVLKSVSSPLLARSAVGGYAASKGFDDHVPVYDGRATDNRAAFSFSAADFRRLLSWPQYKDGQEELPLESVVSVGYTLSTYLAPTGRVLSSNIQFVIVLATPLVE